MPLLIDSSAIFLAPHVAGAPRRVRKRQVAAPPGNSLAVPLFRQLKYFVEAVIATLCWATAGACAITPLPAKNIAEGKAIKKDVFMIEAIPTLWRKKLCSKSHLNNWQSAASNRDCLCVRACMHARVSHSKHRGFGSVGR